MASATNPAKSTKFAKLLYSDYLDENGIEYKLGLNHYTRRFDPKDPNNNSSTCIFNYDEAFCKISFTLLKYVFDDVKDEKHTDTNIIAEIAIPKDAAIVKRGDKYCTDKIYVNRFYHASEHPYFNQLDFAYSIFKKFKDMNNGDKLIKKFIPSNLAKKLENMHDKSWQKGPYYKIINPENKSNEITNITQLPRFINKKNLEIADVEAKYDDIDFDYEKCKMYCSNVNIKSVKPLKDHDVWKNEKFCQNVASLYCSTFKWSRPVIAYMPESCFKLMQLYDS